jgi:hypothetical protein
MTNWIKAQIIPKQWEGTRKLCWRRTFGCDEFLGVDIVPVGFSREDRHCDGFFYANLPEPPERERDAPNA